MSDTAVTPIAELGDGAAGRVVGRVVPATSTLLTSALGARPCVYWDVRRGLSDAPERYEAQDFWVQDESGRVLVRADALEVSARAERQKTVVETATSDFQAVSARLKELKDQLRELQGPAAAPVRQERRRLSKVATLLCAVRAHARGNVHLGGTLASQAKWIEEHRRLADGKLGSKTVQLVVDSWEVTLEPGSQVELRGTFHHEPMPASYGADGGYRQAPTCLTARGSRGGPVIVEGRGGAAPSVPRKRSTSAKTGSTAPRSDGEPPRLPVRRAPKIDPLVWITFAVVSAAVAVTWVLTR